MENKDASFRVDYPYTTETGTVKRKNQSRRKKRKKKNLRVNKKKRSGNELICSYIAEGHY